MQEPHDRSEVQGRPEALSVLKPSRAAWTDRKRWIAEHQAMDASYRYVTHHVPFEYVGAIAIRSDFLRSRHSFILKVRDFLIWVRIEGEVSSVVKSIQIANM